MQVVLFDEDDLTANREGRLSANQKKRFIKGTRATILIFLLSGILLSALFVWAWEGPQEQLPWVIPAFMLYSFTIIGIYCYWIGSKVYKAGIVESTTGTAIFERRFGEMYLLIGGVYFRSHRWYRESFVPGVLYKIYFAPSDNTIVSIEVLD